MNEARRPAKGPVEATMAPGDRLPMIWNSERRCYEPQRAKPVQLCKCEDGQNDPDHTGLCIDCGRPWELLPGEVEA